MKEFSEALEDFPPIARLETNPAGLPGEIIEELVDLDASRRPLDTLETKDLPLAFHRSGHQRGFADAAPPVEDDELCFGAIREAVADQGELVFSADEQHEVRLAVVQTERNQLCLHF
jgi:hypothetical protein